jgi:putative hydrolase of the HAD superfamily
VSATRVLAVDLGGVVFLPATDGDPWAALGDQLRVPPALVQSALWHSGDVEAANVGRLSAEDYAARAAERLGVSGAAVLTAIESVYAGRLNEPLVDYLRAVAATTTVAAVTNNWSFLDRLLARHGIADLFDVVINSAEVGCCKPSPRFFGMLLERLGCEADDVVFVDDDATNVAAARSLGLPSVHFDSPQALSALDAAMRRAAH